MVGLTMTEVFRGRYEAHCPFRTSLRDSSGIAAARAMSCARSSPPGSKFCLAEISLSGQPRRDAEIPRVPAPVSPGAVFRATTQVSPWTASFGTFSRTHEGSLPCLALTKSSS